MSGAVYRRASSKGQTRVKEKGTAKIKKRKQDRTWRELPAGECSERGRCGSGSCW